MADHTPSSPWVTCPTRRTNLGSRSPGWHGQLIHFSWLLGFELRVNWQFKVASVFGGMGPQLLTGLIWLYPVRQLAMSCLAYSSDSNQFSSRLIAFPDRQPPRRVDVVNPLVMDTRVLRAQ